MFINQQYDFDWSDSYEQAFYASEKNRTCDCAWTWDAL